MSHDHATDHSMPFHINVLNNNNNTAEILREKSFYATSPGVRLCGASLSFFRRMTIFILHRLNIAATIAHISHLLLTSCSKIARRGWEISQRVILLEQEIPKEFGKRPRRRNVFCTADATSSLFVISRRHTPPPPNCPLPSHLFLGRPGECCQVLSGSRSREMSIWRRS